jgi:hypothetical protein
MTNEEIRAALQKAREEYLLGWADAESYRGYPSGASKAYMLGFDNCCASYHKIGWYRKSKDGKSMLGTKKKPGTIPGKLYRLVFAALRQSA